VSGDRESLRQRVEKVEKELAALRPVQCRRTVRRRSEASFLGLPVWEIAVGPDLERGEPRGHARAIIAIGDIATGWLAIGGFARGIIALGGCAVGGISLGGVSLGLFGALGGLAVGTIALGGAAVGLVALGGGALGYVAMGGGAIGHYAAGGDAAGHFILTARRQDPEAVRFFQQWLPLLELWLPGLAGR
jgi:hypothetical protein